MDVDNNDNVYSLALAETESVHTAHEKNMAQYRDMLQEEDSPQASHTTMALEPTLHQHSIQSEDFGKERMTAHASQEQRLSGRVVAGAGASMPSSNRMTAASKKPARKATTAANFFASKPSSKSKATSTATTKKTSTAKKPPAAKKTKTDHTKPKAAYKKKKKKNDGPEDMDVDDDDDDTAVQEEKENSVNKKVGNADDFVGDEDEDEDFLESERERKRRNDAREKKTKARATKKTKEPVEEEDDDEPVDKVHGAMDAFAQHQEKKPQAVSKNKRRKRLVEKTTMDANGYIHTETQAVWEDVDDEEEEESAPAKAAPVKKAPIKNTKNMKQGSLMGFFKKK